MQLTRRAQTVHEVLWNGSNLTGWSLNYGPQGTIVTFAQQIHGISTVEVIYTPLQGAETAALRTKLRRCRQAAVWGGVGASAVLLWEPIEHRLCVGTEGQQPLRSISPGTGSFRSARLIRSAR